MSKRKNVSTNYKNGTIVVTRDQYLDKTTYYSPGHSNPKDFYRMTLIVDSNKDNELVLVPFTTHRGKTKKGSVGDYVYVEDSYGNKIILPSEYFKLRRGKTISKYEVNLFKKRLFKTGENALRNRELVRKHIKKRK